MRTQGGTDAATLEGTLERVVYQNDESRWTVARLRLAGSQEVTTIVGNLPELPAGQALRLEGRWIVDKKYGEQFRVERYQPITPATAAGIIRYLGSGLIPGVGIEIAKRIVERFGTDTLKVIEKDPARLTEVVGIGKARAERIHQGLGEQKHLQEVMVFLQGHGVSPAYAVRIVKKYGPGAITIVQENPYRLAVDIWGIGFKTADAIARSLGIGRDSPARAEAGLLHTLGALVDDGNEHAPEHELLAAAEKELGISPEILRPAIDRLVTSGRFVREDLADRGDCLWLRPLWEAEVKTAMGLTRLLQTDPPKLDLDVEKAIDAFEKERGLTLAAQQREAIRAALHDKLVVITGGPGVGKTTIVNGILRILQGQGRRVLLTAPTGRAAKRLTETTGTQAATLHRLLEFMPRTGNFERHAGRQLEADVVIVDESSMLDIVLASNLVAAVPASAQLILVGDVDQLPSVGAGRVLADVIAASRPYGRTGSRPAPTLVRLTEIFRQAAASSIVVNAHRVHRGELPELPAHEGSDFYFVEREEPAQILATILEIVAERIPRRFGFDSIDDVQVLTPMHRGEVGSQNLNVALQARLNPQRPGLLELTRGARVYRVGDKVMQIRNDYDKEVFNGDVGRLSAIKGEEGERQVVVEIDGRPVVYEESELDQLVHAYAVSVHKAQGSEYAAIVVPVVTQHFMLLQRNLLYTAITRGKKLVVLVGTRKALGIAVRNDDTRLRWTWLSHRLEANLQAGSQSGGDFPVPPRRA